MAVATVAPIAARAAGVYKTGQRNVPAATYQEIVFKLIFNTEATDFQAGDVIHGAVEISTDGGTTWGQLCEAKWFGATSSGRGYAVAVDNLTVPANSFYRASATVTPGVPGGTVTFGVTADATLAP